MVTFHVRQRRSKVGFHLRQCDGPNPPIRPRRLAISSSAACIRFRVDGGRSAHGAAWRWTDQDLLSAGGYRAYAQAQVMRNAFPRRSPAGGWNRPRRHSHRVPVRQLIRCSQSHGLADGLRTDGNNFTEVE